MKNVQIKMSIIDNLGEETVISQKGSYDKVNTITFNEKEVLVKIKMDNIIVIERKSNEYEMKLIFDEENMTKSSYIIYNPNMVLELKIKTLMIKKDRNSFYIKYKLTMNNEEIGIFIIDFKWEE
ncbi:MAG TPA: DUF1934 family protein [Mollicutes bacterium]|nr:DUF1934 family protein [Mollicutes bacterium]